MTTLREIILSHGGSFEKVPNKASFWLPEELCISTERWNSFCAAMHEEGRDFKPVPAKDYGGWCLMRFVGTRKPYRIFRVNDRTAQNNVSNHLVIRIDPTGVIEIREKNRRTGFKTTAAAVYVQCMMAEAFKARMAKAKARKAKKKSRR